MNILITGCAGFIGSNVANVLVKDNNIIGIDTFDDFYAKSVKEDNIKYLRTNKKFVFCEYDVRDKKSLKEIFNKYDIDVVIHLAAKSGIRASYSSPEECVSVNVQGTINVLECMKENNVKKIIFASSSSVYQNCNVEKMSEDCNIVAPLSPYAQSKKTCEEFIKLYSHKYDISAIVLRFFTVYGPKQRPDLAIYKFADAIKNGLLLYVYGDGSSNRDYVYIDDVVLGIVAAIYYNKTKFEIINIGSSTSVSLNDLIKYIETEVGKTANVVYLEDQEGDCKRSCADISKAHKLLNYQPKISFKEGLHKYITTCMQE